MTVIVELKKGTGFSKEHIMIELYSDTRKVVQVYLSEERLSNRNR